MEEKMKKLTYLMVMVIALGFIAYGQTEWTEYEFNPIFGQAVGGPKAYYPSVLYSPDGFQGQDPSFKYLMWYGTSGSTTGLALSVDGIIWDDQGVVMTDGYHANVEYYPHGFSGANTGENPNGAIMYYRIWYWDGPLYTVNALGYAESPDGINWDNLQSCKNGNVPIISGVHPEWNRGSYGPCDILYNNGASNTGTDWIFTMYYDGTTGGTESIGLGFSSDGITWTGYDDNADGKADPVLTGAFVVGAWDYNYVSAATIIKNDENNYEMWFSGGNGRMNHGIGYATSTDGIDWTKDSNNPLFYKSDTGYPNEPWRNSRTYCPSVIKDGSTYKMWFAGKGKIGGYYSIGYTFLLPPVVETASFVVGKAKIDFKKKPDDDKIYVKGEFELDLENGDGVNISEDVTFTIGKFSEMIIMSAKGKGKKWEYKREKGSSGNIKDMKIEWKKDNTAKFEIHIDKADLGEMSDWINPVNVSIQIGDDVGQEAILMKEKKHSWDYKK